MRPLSEYSERILEHKLAPPDSVGRTARRRSSRRAAARPWTDETITRVLDDLAAQQRFGDLPLGRVDAASWARREEFVRLARQRLEDLALRPGAETSRLIADHVALDTELRFPALTDAFQAVLESLERDWGYRQSFAADLDLPGMPPGRGTVFALQRETGWPAARLAGGVPSGLGPRADSRTHRVPDHVVVSLHRGLALVELWMWPHADDAEGSGWVHVWFALQDHARLVPFDTSLVTLVEPALLADLPAFAAAAVDWHEVLVQRHRSVFTPSYQRDGMPVPRWRDDPR